MNYYFIFGGSWYDVAVGCRIIDYDIHTPDHRYGNGGFRLIKKLKQ